MEGEEGEVELKQGQEEVVVGGLRGVREEGVAELKLGQEEVVVGGLREACEVEGSLTVEREAGVELARVLFGEEGLGAGLKAEGEGRMTRGRELGGAGCPGTEREGLRRTGPEGGGGRRGLS